MTNLSTKPSAKCRNALSIMTAQSEGGRLIVKLREESCEKNPTFIARDPENINL